MTHDFDLYITTQEQTVALDMQESATVIDPCLCEYIGTATDLLPATDETLGGIKVGAGLKIANDGTLSVDTAEVVEEDNTKPITSDAVYTVVGNINALLSTI